MTFPSPNSPAASRGTLFTTGSGATTPGTTVAQQAAITAFSDTGPIFVIQNTGSTGQASIFPAYLRLMSGAAMAGGLNLELAVKVDTPGQSQLPTNSNQYTNPTIWNGDTRDATQSVARLYHYLAAQALVAPASTSGARVVSRARVPTGVGVSGDEYVFQFGAHDFAHQSARGLTAARATDTARVVSQAAAFSIAPGCWAKIYVWWITAGSAPTWETELGWYEAV